MTTILSDKAIKLPVGTTAQRPTAASGQVRFNSTAGGLETYSGATTSWNRISPRFDGSTQQLAVPHARFLIQRGITTNGYYWINIGGTPKLVYCDLQAGGWMYLIPPAAAEDQNPFNVTINLLGSNSNESNNIPGQATYGDWRVYGGYTSGDNNRFVRLNVSWTNNMETTEVRLVSASTGINNTLSVNGTNIGANRTNSFQTYWSDSSPTCSANICFLSSTHWNSATPRTFASTGNLSIVQIAYSQGNTHGGSPWIGNVSVR